MSNTGRADDNVKKNYDQEGEKLAFAIFDAFRESGELTVTLSAKEEQDLLYYFSAIGRALGSKEEAFLYLRESDGISKGQNELPRITLINRGYLGELWDWYYQNEYGIYV